MNKVVNTLVSMAVLCALMVPTLASAGVADKAEVLDATVKIERVNDFALAVQIFPISKTNARQSYTFHSDKSLPWVPSELGKSQVIVKPGTLLIFSEEGESIALTTGADTSMLARFEKANLISVGGYQLTRYLGEIDPAQVILGDGLGLNKRMNDGPTGDGLICLAGGPGATSCSLTISGEIEGLGGIEISCQADNCAEGEYACCSILGCFCKME